MLTMPDLSDTWLDRIKQTIAVDLGRFMGAGMPPRAIVEKLFEIPEVQQAFELRARARRDRTGKWELIERLRTKMFVIALVAFALGFAAPIAALRYSTTCYECTTDKDVTLMPDGSAEITSGSGHLAYPTERFVFYVIHPRAPRPWGHGRLWIMGD